MKQIVIILFCVAMLTPVVLADKIVSKKRMSYRGKLIGCKDYTVSIKISSRKTLKKPLADIGLVVSDSNKALTKAEQAGSDKKFSEALELYDQAEQDAKTSWMKRLVQIRRFQVLGKSGKIDDAVKQWIKRCDESPVALGLVPTVFAVKSSKENAAAIDAVETKIKLLEKDPEKNKVYIKALLNLKMEIQAADGTSATPADPVPSAKPVVEKAVDEVAKETTIAPANPKTEPKVGNQSGRLDMLVEMLKGGEADKVIDQIEASIGKYTRNQLPEALLLLGKAQLQKFQAGGGADKKLPVAAGLNFMRVYVNFGKAPQAPEALYLAGVANEIIGDKPAVRSAMTQLVTQYAKDDADNEFVAKARKKLTELDKKK
ncbi:MAG: hypothetical protein KAR11_02935 [Phycisphaerae bacterium]|nr:hypothetical protein [Phycisphaerae bacterium]